MYALPHQRLDEQLLRSVPWKPVLVLTVCAIASMALLVFTQGHDELFQCLVGDKTKNPPEPDATRWQALLVANLLIFFVGMVLSGAPPEVTLFFSGCIAVLAGALDPNKLFAGSASGAVVTLALLFPIMKAMGDTGIPEKFIGQFMGNPKSLRPAMLRMFVAVALLSSLFNNTPIVILMIPLLVTFCQRLDLDHRAMLMPLSYAAQAGGSLTIMGTSINFVAAEIFGRAGYYIGFFTLTLGGIVIAALDAAFCCVMGPILLATQAAPSSTTTRRGVQGQSMSQTLAEVRLELGKKNVFSVAIIIQDQSPLAGSAVKECGIHRIKGVELLLRVLRRVAPERSSMIEMSSRQRDRADTALALEQHIQDWSHTTDQCPSEISHIDAQYQIVVEGWEEVKDFILKAGDVVQVAATAGGIATLRNVRGLELGNEAAELAYLGARRRHRHLCEASVAVDLVGTTIDVVEWRLDMKCAIVGIRSLSQPTLCRMSFQGYKVQTGDVLLLEAFGEMVGSDAWLEKFSVVRKVPNSAPPRNGLFADMLRAIYTAVGLLVMILLAMLGNKRLSMPVMGTMFLSSLLVIKGLTLEEAYSEVNGRVLLTIVGALAFGTSMEETRLANCMAGGVVSFAKPMGPMGIRVGIYVATVGIGQFLNSAANVAIMGSIAIPVAAQMEMPVGEMAMVVVYAASACYMAPYGYQTNTLVIKDGGYTWGDFIRFGGVLQLFHLILVVCIAPICNRLSPIGSPP